MHTWEGRMRDPNGSRSNFRPHLNTFHPKIQSSGQVNRILILPLSGALEFATIYTIFYPMLRNCIPLMIQLPDGLPLDLTTVVSESSAR